MTEVSLVRLYVLRAMYLFIVVGLAATIWPKLIVQPEGWPLMNSVVSSLLAAVSVLALLGIRYPLQMIPVLLFDLIWKIIWLAAVALPIWSAGEMDERTAQTVIDCMVGLILIPLAVPWAYVVAKYGRQPGDRWRSAARAEEAPVGLR
jgi:hypothetical protein